MRWFVLVMLVATAHVDPAGARPVAAKPRWETLPMPPPMPAATSTGTVEIDGAKIFYATWLPPAGARSTTPVILLHGGLGNGDHYGFQLPALADKYHVVAIDSRGQGRSTMPPKQKLSYAVMAKDVLAVMDALKIDKAALVGWSDGGAIALDLAINHPKRVDRLFVFGTNYHSSGTKPRRGPTADTFNRYAVKCKSDMKKLTKSSSAYQQALAAILPVWRTPGGFTKEQLKSIQALAVVADGDRDEIIELDHVREMALLIPNASLVIFRDASHFVHWQDPESFNKALLEFLEKPALPPPAAN